MVMKWLDTRTGCMPSRGWGGTPWPPTHLSATQFFLWGIWKRKCTNLSLETLLLWRGKLGVEFGRIPEVMVQKSIMNMKKRGDLMVGVPPHSSRNWWQASCPGRWCLAISSPTWPGVAWPYLVATHFIWAWLALGSASWQGRPCPLAAACRWTGWSYHLLAGIRAQNVDLRLDFLLHFHEYLIQKCS